jgi:hypothetical protein
MKQRFLIASIIILIALFFVPVYAQDGIDTLIELFERGLRITGESTCNDGGCSYDFTVRVADEIVIPTVTSTPTVTNTSTFTPTATSTSTLTNTPVVTDEPPTPTQEVTELPPTFTETPVPKMCVLKNDNNVTNIRIGPGTNYARITEQWSYGEEARFDEFFVGETYMWGHMELGWVVVRSGTSWWVYGTEGTELCDEVSGWPAGLDPPDRIVANPLTGATRPGIHFAWFSDRARVAQTAPYIGIVKCLTLSGTMCETARNHNSDMVTVFRDVRSECPSREQIYTDPDGYYERLKTLWSEHPNYDYYEIMNECSGLRGADDFAALAQFSIRVAERAADDGRCILALSSYPGSPELDEFIQLVPYFQWADTHPCGKWETGAPKFHGLATHATGYCPFSTPNYPWVGWSWVAGRHILFAEAVAQTTGYQIKDKNWPWLITELGFTYGQDEDENAFTAEELRACVGETTAVLIEQGIVNGYMLWNVGKVGVWLDYVNYLPFIFIFW